MTRPRGHDGHTYEDQMLAADSDEWDDEMKTYTITWQGETKTVQAQTIRQALREAFPPPHPYEWAPEKLDRSGTKKALVLNANGKKFGYAQIVSLRAGE